MEYPGATRAAGCWPERAPGSAAPQPPGPGFIRADLSEFAL